MVKGLTDKMKGQPIKELEESYSQAADLNNVESIVHKLEISELRYRRLFETAQDGILILDADTGKIIDVNPFLIGMLGYSKEEFLGKRLWEVGAFKNIEAAKSAFAKLQSERYIRYEDMPLEAKNGRLINVEFVSNVYDVDHTSVIQCNIRDNTDRKQAEQRYKTLFESASEGILIADIEDRKERYANPAICTMLGYTQEELTKMSVTDIHPKDSLDYVLAEFSAQVRGEKKLSTLPCLKKDGTIFYADINAAKAIIDGRECNIGFFTDITERKRVEVALEQAAERDSAIAKLASRLVSPTSIKDISNLVLESAERFTDSSIGFVGYIDPETGYMVSPTMTRGIWKSFCTIKDKTVIFKKLGGLWGWVLNNQRSILTNIPANDPRSTGTPSGHIPIRNFLSAPALINKELVGQVALANSSRSYDEQDLTFIERLATLFAVALQRKKLEDTISQLAYHDPLTGLPSRILFNDRCTLALARAKRYRKKMALLVLDMDRFKNINDTLGHEAGDNLLRDFGNRLVSTLRTTDTVSRMGGDEFVVLLPDVIKGENIANVAQKILEAARKPFILLNREVRITTSIGIAIYPEDGEDIGILLKHADKAMYHVKGKERNNYQLYARIMSTLPDLQ